MARSWSRVLKSEIQCPSFLQARHLSRSGQADCLYEEQCESLLALHHDARGHASKASSLLAPLAYLRMMSPSRRCGIDTDRHWNQQRLLQKQLKPQKQLKQLKPQKQLKEQKLQKQQEEQKLQKQQKQQKHGSAPRGCFVVYVGQIEEELEKKTPIVVKASVLNHPLFASFLLEKAREEFGFEHEGPITIPCEIAFFEHVMHLIESGQACYRSSAS